MFDALFDGLIIISKASQAGNDNQDSRRDAFRSFSDSGIIVEGAYVARVWQVSQFLLVRLRRLRKSDTMSRR